MNEKIEKRIRRHKRIRKKILGTNLRPRLSVFRGLSNLQAQLIDDIGEQTILSLSTYDQAVKKKVGYGGNVAAAKILGELLAECAKQKGISQIVFDRAGFTYHGRIKALAEAMRNNGVKF